MNKNHRVIWSTIRNCFVVASEIAKAKGKPSSTRKTVAAAIAALFIAPGAASAADCGNETNISGAVGAQCYTDQSVTINGTGSISVGSGNAVNVSALPYTQTFINNGKVEATSQYGGATVYFYGGVSGSIVNNGVISSKSSSNGSYSQTAVYISGDLSGSFTNSSTGTISIEGRNSDAYNYNGVYINGDISSTGSLNNAGSIIVKADNTTSSAYAYGIFVGSNLDGSLTNSGTISATAIGPTSAYAYGVNVGEDLNGRLTNSGTISATAVADDSYASAYGVYVGGSLNGTLTNSGTIAAKTNVYSSSSGYAYGVYVGSDLAGSLVNTSTGTISAEAKNTDSYTPYAYGVYVRGNLSGSLSNAGKILATATADSDYAYAYGVYVNNDLSGSLTNSGTIAAKANVYSSSYAEAYGVYVGGNLNGSLVNTSTGTITAEAKNTHSYTPYAHGVYVDGSLSGSLSNAGQILATATGNTDYAYAYGVYVDDDLSGSLTNTGTISAKATVTDSSSAYAYGVYANNITGTLTNKGTISATASNVGDRFATGSAYAYGIYANGIGSTGSIVNEGTITATANAINNTKTGNSAYAYGIYNRGSLVEGASILNSGTIQAIANGSGNTDYGYASAYGIYVSNSLDGVINNSGTITATANATPADSVWGSAYGIYVGSVGSTGSIVNSGTINASANVYGTYSATAYGINVGEDVNGSISNSGTITATATGRAGEAYGISVDGNLNASGEITNTGSITATASAGTASRLNFAYGVYVNNLNGGTITNSGTISAFAEASAPGEDNAYSISTSGVGTINNLAGGVLDGQVFAGGAISLNNDGLLNTRLGESHVGEDYNQGTTGVFKLSAVDDATYGSLYARGTATLAEGTTIRVAVDPAHTLAAGSVLQNVIYGDSGLNMGTVNVQDNNLSLNFTAADNTLNGVDLTATSTGLTTVVAAVTGAGLGSAAGAGGVLDTLLANPDAQSPQLTSFLYALGGASTAQEVTNRVAELLPLMSGSVNHATLDTMRMLNLAINQRLDAKAGVAGGDLAFTDKHFWLKPFGSWANQDKRNGALGYDANTYGLAFGADGQLSDANTVGLAISYARTDIDSDMIRQNADVDSYQAAIYGSHKFSDVTSLNYQADFGYHDNSGRRFMTGIGSAKSDYDSWSGHVGASLAHTIAIDEATTFTPSVRADYSRIRAESYREKGTGVLLDVGSETTDELILGADGKLARSISEKATAFANLGVGYDVINERTSMTSSFAGVPGAVFTTRGIDPSPWLVRGGLGIVGQATETLELSLRYDFEVRNDFDNQTASVKARWAF